ncbi:MAG: M23 family metallopeptidase [Candidatus Neomarinimicrobiota bacterium]
MNRKNPHSSRQLKSASIALDDPQFLIRDELNRYLARKLAIRRRIVTYSIRGLAALGIILLSYLYLPGLVRTVIFGIRYTATQRMGRLVQKNAYVIKLGALTQFPLATFADYEIDDNKRPSEVEKYAILINRFNNDFYGKVYGLTDQYEQRLLAYLAFREFNGSDLLNLDRKMLDDSLHTLRTFILEKVYEGNQRSDYFNPVIDEIRRTITLYQGELDNAIRKPFNRNSLRAMRKAAVHQRLDTSHEDPVVDTAIEFCRENPQAMAEAVYYSRKINELQQEMDIRLGLLYLAIGQDYSVRGDNQNFGWLVAGYKGKTFMAERKAPDKYASYFASLLTDLTAYHEGLKQVRQVYDQINLADWHLQINNPIRIGLKVKDVGLYGSRRKTDTGDYYEHRGIDLVAEKGTPVYPVQDGFVTIIESSANGGNIIEIWHDSNITSVYAHLDNDKIWKRISNRFSAEGPFWVSKNEPIASVGMTGNIPEDSDQYGYAHLHLEIRESARYQNPFLLFNEQIAVIHD